jgi:hypothetical protein
MAGRPRKAPNALAGHRTPRPSLVSIPGGRADEAPTDGRPRCGVCRKPFDKPYRGVLCSEECWKKLPRMPTAGSGVAWLAETLDMWAGVWCSSMAENWRRDLGLYMPALHRWIRLHDALGRAHRAVQRAPMVQGSKNQPRRNPIFDEIPKLEDMLRRLDEQLGMTLLAQVRMGVPIGATGTAQTAAAAAEELEMEDAGWDWAAE